MNRSRFFLAFLTALLSAVVPTHGYAHESRPIYVQITETGPQIFSVHWKVPVTVPLKALPAPVFPQHCVPKGAPIMRQHADAFLTQQRYQCPDGISGHTVGMEFPMINPSLSSLFQVRLLNGERHTYVLKPGQAAWTVPDGESKLGVAKQYTMLGVEHIWGGIDHLLFVACLLFVARTRRKLLITITGFTLAHSLTLALSALELVRLPVPPVEAVIALSIVFLACEIAIDDRTSLTFRYPIAVSSSFGLLHGFGFAAVLREIGLPQTELPTALLFFNLGVEVGQVLFVGLLVGIAWSLRTLFQTSHTEFGLLSIINERQFERLAAYVIGPIAAYWICERIYAFWV